MKVRKYSGFLGVEMPCRNDTGDPLKCDRCGEFLWVIDNGMFCGECGVTMPCTMQIRPAPATLARSFRADST